MLSPSYKAIVWNWALYGGTSEAIDIFVRSFSQLELMRAEELIEIGTRCRENLYLQVARGFILEHLTQKL